MFHSDGFEYKRTAGLSNEVTEFSVLAHAGIGNMLTNIYKAPGKIASLLAGYVC